MTVIPTTGFYVRPRSQPLRRNRKKESIQEGQTPQELHGVRIPIRSQSSSDLQPPSGNIFSSLSRVLPLVVYCFPIWALAALGKEKDAFYRPWSNIVGLFLALIALVLLTPRLPEVRNLSSKLRPSRVAILAAILSATSTLFWNEKAGESGSFPDELQFPALSLGFGPLVDKATTLGLQAFAVLGAVVVVPFAEGLAFRSWLYRETVFLLSMNKEGGPLWTQSADVPFSEWDWFPALQSCAALGMMHNSLWVSTFLSAVIFQGAAYWRGDFVDSLHAHWLYKSFFAILVLLKKH